MELGNVVSEERGNKTLGSEDGVHTKYGCQVICCTFQSKRYPVKFMQFMSNAKSALVLLSFSLLLANMARTGLVPGVINTIENKFQLRSAESSLIATMSDVGTCLALLVMTFRADRAFKPSWFGWGLFTCGSGCLLFALPHFLAPVSNLSKKGAELCGTNDTTDDVKCTEFSVKNYRFVLMIANCMIGAGLTPIIVMILTYFDENVKKNNSSLYGGIAYSIGALGPPIGFFLVAAFLNIHVDVGRNVPIPENTSLWIGAWWIGFILIGAVSILTSVFNFMLPRYFPNTAKYRQQENNSDQTPVNRDKMNVAEKIKFEVGSIILLLRNVRFTCLTLRNCMVYAFTFGFATFGPKYSEKIFGISSTTALLSFGGTAVTAGGLGQFLGGYSITKFKLEFKGIILLLIGMKVLSTLSVFGFFLHCTNQVFMGGSEYSFSPSVITQSCMTSCQCNPDNYGPVCSGGHTTYFSACYAGCTKHINETNFSNCTCAVAGRNTTGYSSESFEVKTGACSATDCNMFYPFIVIAFSSFFTTFLSDIPRNQATIRVVPFYLRDQALSLQRLINILLGSIPSILIIGKILDKACTSWETECGAAGSCVSYDRKLASMYLTLLLLSQKSVSLIFVLISYYYQIRSKTEQVERRGANENFATENTIYDSTLTLPTINQT